MRSAQLVTPDSPGAVALIQITGDAVTTLRQLTGDDRWTSGRLALCAVAGLHDVLAGCLDDEVGFLMPPGGPRAIQRLIDAVRACGIHMSDGGAGDAGITYPEAESEIEAITLSALARAPSPLAVDLLLKQIKVLARTRTLSLEDRKRSRRLNRLIHPPLVVLAGAPNVGKSTLSNRMAGRTLSIAADVPGTTRDYTAVRIDVAGLVVNWVDTPGLRRTGDAIESSAITMARRLLDSADLVIAMADPQADWPDLPRPADLRIANKCDLAARFDADLAISARRGDNMAHLAAAIRERLVPRNDLEHPGPWIFDERLNAHRA